MKRRYKALIILAVIILATKLSIWLSAAAIILLFAYCLVRIGREVNDDCFLDENQYGKDEKKMTVSKEGVLEYSIDEKYIGGDGLY